MYVTDNSSRTDFPNRLDFLSIPYDPEIDLETAFDCGAISTPRTKIFGTTYMYLELTRLEDTRRLLEFPSDREHDCGGVHEAFFQNTTRPYHSWTSTFNFVSILDFDGCDVEKGGAAARCVSQVALTYASQIVRDAKSRSGISQMDIWLNAGAVVGGVQFFFWFLSILGAY